MNYGKKLKDIRESRNLSQTDVANILNIKRSTYGHYETQYQLIPINHLIGFADYFNVRIDYIFDFIININTSLKPASKEVFSNRLKEIRKELNLTQEKLGNKLNTTKTVICSYEHQRCFVATPFLYDLCKKYGISADYLLGRIDTPKYYNKYK